jgi:hypothetical protein
VRASPKDIYAGQRPEDVPAYSLRETAELLGLAPSTLRSWVRGRTFPKRQGQGRSPAIIRPPVASSAFLSFTNGPHFSCSTRSILPPPHASPHPVGLGQQNGGSQAGRGLVKEEIERMLQPALVRWVQDNAGAITGFDLRDVLGISG